MSARKTNIAALYGRPLFRWVAVGTAAVAFVVMREISSQLARAELSGQSFGASLFTGFHPRFWEVEDFASALTVWRSITAIDYRVLVGVHIVADVFFLAAFWSLLVWWMTLVNVKGARLSWLARIGFFSDLLETLSAAVVLLPDGATGIGFMPGAVQFFGFSKWVALGLVVYAAVNAYITDNRGVSLQNTRQSLNAARAGGDQPNFSMLGGIGLLVATFVVLVAFPAGGPLEQIPDVVRAQISPPSGNYWVLARAAIVVGFAAVAVAAAGFIITATGSLQLNKPRIRVALTAGVAAVVLWVLGLWILAALSAIGAVATAGFFATEEAPQPPAVPRRWQLVAIAALVSLILWLVGLIVEGERRWMPWSTLFVVVGVTLIGCLVRQGQPEPSTSKKTTGRSPAQSRMRAVGRRLGRFFRVCFCDPWNPPLLASLSTVDELGREGAPPATSDPPDPAAKQPADVIGGLAGLVTVAAALGLLRASFLPMLFEDTLLTVWFWGFIFGGALAGGGRVTQWAVVSVSELPWVRRRLGRLAALIGVTTLVLGALLAQFPQGARLIGANGSLGAVLAFFATVVAILSWLGNRVVRWDAPVALGLSVRTPWLLTVFVIWAMASFMNTEGGYHDARLAQATPLTGPSEDVGTEGAVPHGDASSEHAVANPVAAEFGTWIKRAETCGTGPIRMFMVAAPGGGIRAAFWTTLALETMFGADSPIPCREHGPFLISGVSGGSVGATTWLATTDGPAAPATAIGFMSNDEALARAVVGMLFRDLPQPLTGLIDPWPDRAELMEMAWLKASDGFFSDDSIELALTDLGQHREGWQPLLLMNGSSVVDGCLVVMVNRFGPDWNSEANCLKAPGTGPLRGWPSSATIGISSNLVERTADICPSEPSDLRTATAITAALLSARFPYVTPSGAIYRCPMAETASGGEPEKPIPTYVVDGGYFENSGLLTLLNVWNSIESEVDQYNVTHDRHVEPWIVVLDNHYSSSVNPPEPKRVPEVLAPLWTRSRILSPEALEQVAALEMSPTIVCDPTGEVGCLSTFVRVAPARAPGIPAPLGWVLSAGSRDELEASLKAAFKRLVQIHPVFEGLDASFDDVVQGMDDSQGE